VPLSRDVIVVTCCDKLRVLTSWKQIKLGPVTDHVCFCVAFGSPLLHCAGLKKSSFSTDPALPDILFLWFVRCLNVWPTKCGRAWSDIHKASYYISVVRHGA
jgi:hypothetical protein